MEPIGACADAAPLVLELELRPEPQLQDWNPIAPLIRPAGVTVTVATSPGWAFPSTLTLICIEVPPEVVKLPVLTALLGSVIETVGEVPKPVPVIVRVKLVPAAHVDGD